jgi:hypothetical protein
MIRQLNRLPSRSAVAVDQEVVRDPIEPGRERDSSRAEAMDGIDHLQEDLLGKVFGIRLVTNPRIEVPIDSIKVPVVELGQRPGIEALGAADEGVFGRLQVAYSI